MLQKHSNGEGSAQKCFITNTGMVYTGTCSQGVKDLLSVPSGPTMEPLEMVLDPRAGGPLGPLGTAL